jgi:glycosyltransferase involved in cell wall biosynthesis
MGANLKTLRIGQFTDSFPPIINGVASFVSEHHQELLAQYQQSFVFTYGHIADSEPQPGVFRTPGIPVGTLPFHVALTLDQRSRQVASTLDIYHVHEPFVIANVAMQMAIKHGKPLIFTNHTRHDTYTNNYPRFVRPSIRQWVTSTIEKVIRASNVSTTPSEDAARWMRSLVPDIADRVRVIRNGIHLNQFEHETRHLSRQDFGIDPSQIVIMYTGRLTPEKNLETFARGFLDAVALGAQVHWVIIGDGNRRATLEEMLAPVQDRVHFLGSIPRTEISAHLAIADIFGTASLSEANPVSVIESMACGLPYVGLAADWWTEFTAHQVGGLLAESPEQLGAAIARLAANAAQRAVLAQSARAISTQFDIRTVTAKWVEIYQAAYSQYQSDAAAQPGA